MSGSVEELAREIERLRRLHLAALEEAAAVLEAPCAWEMAEEVLCWHVVLRDVLEPDLDIEVLEDALVVRAAVEGSMGMLRRAVLPVPRPFDPRRPAIRFEAGVLEVRILRVRGGGDGG